MKTAISLPDDLFATADAYAERSQLSRSELYARALREYLGRHDQDRVTAQLDAVKDARRSAAKARSMSSPSAPPPASARCAPRRAARSPPRGADPLHQTHAPRAENRRGRFCGGDSTSPTSVTVKRRISSRDSRSSSTSPTSPGPGKVSDLLQ